MRWWPLGALALAAVLLIAYGAHERRVGAWRERTRVALARADSARDLADEWEERYRAARRDSAATADSLATLGRRVEVAEAERLRLVRRRTALGSALARASTTRDSLATALRTVAALDTALARSEEARRADSLRAEILRVDRDRWRAVADSAAEDLARARRSIAELREQLRRAPVRGGGGWAGHALAFGAGLALGYLAR